MAKKAKPASETTPAGVKQTIHPTKEHSHNGHNSQDDIESAEGLDVEGHLSEHGAPPSSIHCNPSEVSDISNLSEVSDITTHSAHSAFSTACILETLEEAIQWTLPSSPKSAKRCLFNYVRCLRSMAAYKGIDGSDLYPEFSRWYEQAKPKLGKKQDSIWWYDQFLFGYDNVKVPIGDSVMNAVVLKARQRPIPPKLEQLANPGIGLLCNICHELQQQAGQGEFFLSCQTVSDALMLNDSKLAWRYLNVLKRHGAIEQTTPGNKKKAARYRYRWPS